MRTYDWSVQPDQLDVGRSRARRTLTWLWSAARRLHDASGSRRWRPFLLAAAAALFITVSVISYASLPNDVRLNAWLFALLVLAAVPAMIVANAAEYVVIARISGHQVPVGEAARLTVAVTAANLLPLPGGILIRTQALKSKGASYKTAFGANACAGLAWLGSAALGFAAVAFLDGGHPTGASIVAIAGLAVIGATLALLVRIRKASAPRRLYELLLVELFTVAVSSVRIYLAFRMIGLEASATQAVALTGATILAAAVGIFPGGLGLRELLAGVIGAVVSLPASEAVAATAADRVAGLVGISIIAALLAACGSRAAGDQAVAAPPSEITTA